jgi:hypothetical protein
MKLTVEMTETDIRKVLASHINETFGTDFTYENLPIQVKSKQNYRSEWEEASIRIQAHVIR